MSKLIDELKARYKDDRTAAEITWDIGQQLESSNDKDIFSKNPDFAQEYYDIKRSLRPSAAGEAWAGFKTALMDRLPEELLRTASSVYTMGKGSEMMDAYLANPALQEKYGYNVQKYMDEMSAPPADPIQQSLLDQADREKAEGDERRGEVSVPNLDSVHSAGDLARWGFVGLGENLPQLAATLLPGAAMARYGRGAQAVVALAANSAQNIGSELGDLPRADQAKPGAAASSVITGSIAGVLNTASEYLPFSGLAESVKNRALRVLANAGISALGAAPTGAVQEAINIANTEVATGDKIPDDVAKDRILNAGILGGLVGAQIGAAVGAFSKHRGADVPQAESPAAQPSDISGEEVAPAPEAIPSQPAPEVSAADAALSASQEALSDMESLLREGALRSQARFADQADLDAMGRAASPGPAPALAPTPGMISDMDAIGFDADMANAGSVAQRIAEQEQLARRQSAQEAFNRLGYEEQGAPPAAADTGFAQDMKTDLDRELAAPIEQGELGQTTYADPRNAAIESPSAYSESPEILGAIPSDNPLDVQPVAKERTGSLAKEARSIEKSAPIAKQEEMPAKAEPVSQFPLAPAITPEQRVPGGSPLFGKVFTPDDGGSLARIESSVSGWKFEGDPVGVTRKAVVMLDRATGQVLVRGIRRGETRRTEGSKKETAVMIDSISGREAKFQAKTVIDPAYGDKRAAWDFVSEQNYRGMPRFDVMGFFVYDKPQANISYTLNSIDDLNRHPALSNALTRYESRGDGESAMVRRKLAPYFDSGQRLAASDLAKYKSRLSKEDFAKLVEANKAIPQKRTYAKTRTVDPAAARFSGSEIVSLESADIPGGKSPAEAMEASEEPEGGVDMLVTGGGQPQARENIRQALSEIHALIKKSSSYDAIFNAAKKVLVENPEVRRSIGLRLGDKDPQIDKRIIDAARALTKRVIDQQGSSIALTTRAESGYVASEADANVSIGQLFAAAKGAGADVVLLQRELDSQWNAISKGYGFVANGSSKNIIVGVVGDWLHGTAGSAELVKAAHEAAHVFLENSGSISPDDYHLFQSAVAQLPWTQRNYLNNPLSTDIRIIANTSPDFLSEEQKKIMLRVTPDELKEARLISPEELAVEQATDHLALWGIKQEVSRNFFGQLIRFIKDVGYRIALSFQKVWKGPDATNPSLVNAYVQNKFLQWINRDFAASNSSIALSLREWIGAPTTPEERLPVYANIDGDSTGNIWYDPITKTATVDDIVTDDVAALRDQIRGVLGAINDGSDIRLSVAPAERSLIELAAGVPFDNLSTDQQVALIQESQKQMAAVLVQRDAAGRLLAPTGKQSKLTESVYRMVRTPLFAGWFGDWLADPTKASKVIDPETGEPMVVYHGTATAANFDVFREKRHMGHHFGTLMQAEDVVDTSRRVVNGKVEETTFKPWAKLYQVFLNIRNPVRLKDNGNWEAKEVANEMFAHGIFSPEEAAAVVADQHMSNYDGTYPSQSETPIVTLMKSKGVDGVVYKNEYEGAYLQRYGVGPQDSWIAFDPTQIKSIYNRTYTPSESIRFTKRAGEAITPEAATIEANTQFAGINHLAGVFDGLLKNADVRRFLPAATTPDEFLSKFLQLPENKNPASKSAALEEEINKSRTAADNLPISYDKTAAIADLPASADGSSPQQKAIRNALIQLNQVKAAVARRRNVFAERLDELSKRKNNLTSSEQSELDKINSRIPMLDRILSLKDVGLDDQIARLESKIGAGYLWYPAPGAEYLVPPSANADEAAIRSSTAKIPAGMAFDTPARQQLYRNIASIKEWLNNPANREKGAIYGQMEIQLRKLATVSAEPTYTANTFRLRNMFFDSLRNMLRGIGTPNAKYLGGRFDEFEGSMLRWGNKLTISGGAWSVAYQNFKKAVGWKGADGDFRRNYWNSIVSFAEDIPDGVKDPSGAIMEAMAKVAKRPIPPEAQSAFRDLMRSTRENNGLVEEAFADIGLKVSDPKIKDELQRSLIRQGHLTGRRSISEQLERVVQEMRTAWSNTDQTDVIDMADELNNSDPAALSAGLRKRFTPSILKNFVEPLIYHNRQFIPGVANEQGISGMASLANIREAYEKSEGDMLKFSRLLNMMEGGSAATEADFVKSTLGSFDGVYKKAQSIINDRKRSHNSGVETLPRQIMDARQAEDLPPEFVSYALYDSGSNRAVLHQMALNGAFGRDGLTTGLFARNLNEVIDELKGLHIELSNYLINDGLTKEEAKKKMGVDRYTIALQSPDHLKLLNRFRDKMEMVTKSSGELLADMRVFDELLGLNAMMILQSPRSALVNSLDLLGPIYRLKLSTPTLSALYNATKRFGSDMAVGLMESVGVNLYSDSELRIRMKRLGFTDPDLYLDFKDRMADFGAGNSLDKPEGIEPGLSVFKRNAILLTRRIKQLANLGVGDVANAAIKGISLGRVGLGDGILKPGENNSAPKLRLMGIFNTTAHSLTNAAIEGQYKVFSDLVSRGVDFIKNSADPRVTMNALADGSLKLSPDDLGYTRKWMVFNDRAAFDYMQNAISEKMDQGSLERMVSDAYARQLSDPKAQIITDKQFGRIASLALTEIQLNSNSTNTPIDLKGNGLWKMMSPFITWPYLAMLRVPATFKDANGRYTMSAAFDGAAAMAIGAIPLTMAASLLVDLYDEDVVGKRSNLREADLDSALPIVGPYLYPMATLERLARYGAGGLASEAINSALNFDDARGGFSADTRILVFSQLQNVKTIIGNLWQQEGNYNYASVVRPLAQFIGAGGVLQYQQILNKQLGLSNEESAINDRINVGNYLKAVGRDLDLDVRISRGPSSLPSPVTPYLQQMELAVYLDDPDKFRDAYQDAVREYRELHPSEPDPAKQVISSFQGRHPLRRIFKTLPSSAEYRNILDDLNPSGYEAVTSGVKLFNKYLSKLGAKPVTWKPEDSPAAMIRKQVLSDSAIRDAQAMAAQMSYRGIFGN